MIILAALLDFVSNMGKIYSQITKVFYPQTVLAIYELERVGLFLNFWAGGF